MASKKSGGYQKPPQVQNSANSTLKFLTLPTHNDFGEEVEAEEIKSICRKAVAKALSWNSTDLTFKELPDSTTGVQGLEPSNSSSHYDDLSYLSGEKVTPLIKWFEHAEKPDSKTTYWIGLRLSFARLPKRSKLCIEHLSLTVAKTFSGSLPEEVLRAEWGFYSGSETKHAQPHWHIFGEGVSVRDGLWKNLESGDSQQSPVQDFAEAHDIVLKDFTVGWNETLPLSTSLPPIQTSGRSIGKFHFAMCAYWDKKTQIVSWPIKRPDIEHWIMHCLTYIRQELEYVHKKET
jgi:hypothetical protein